MFSWNQSVRVSDRLKVLLIADETGHGIMQKLTSQHHRLLIDPMVMNGCSAQGFEIDRQCHIVSDEIKKCAPDLVLFSFGAVDISKSECSDELVLCAEKFGNFVGSLNIDAKTFIVLLDENHVYSDDYDVVRWTQLFNATLSATSANCVCFEDLVSTLTKCVYSASELNLVDVETWLSNNVEDVYKLGRALIHDKKHKFIQDFQSALCNNWKSVMLRLTLPSAENVATKTRQDYFTDKFITLRHIVDLVETCVGSRVKNITLSCIGARVTTSTHLGYSPISKYILRVHIPLCVAPTKSGVIVNGKRVEHQMSKLFAFDDTYPHCGFNEDCEERVVLILDVARPEHTQQYSQKFVPFDQETMRHVSFNFKAYKWL